MSWSYTTEFSAYLVAWLAKWLSLERPPANEHVSGSVHGHVKSATRRFDVQYRVSTAVYGCSAVRICELEICGTAILNKNLVWTIIADWHKIKTKATIADNTPHGPFLWLSHECHPSFTSMKRRLKVYISTIVNESIPLGQWVLGLPTTYLETGLPRYSVEMRAGRTIGQARYHKIRGDAAGPTRIYNSLGKLYYIRSIADTVGLEIEASNSVRF